MALRTVVLPTSVGPVEWIAGLVLGTLAFPADARKSSMYADAYWREVIRKSAIEDAEIANTPRLIPPRLFVMGDSTCDRLLKEGDKALFERKRAWFATQVLFAGALRGAPYETIIDGTGSWPVTAENRYLATLRWQRGENQAYTSTKPVINEAITPSKPAIHLAYALFDSLSGCVGDKSAKDEGHALSVVLGSMQLLARVLNHAAQCRAIAMTIPELKVSEDDLIEMFAV